MIRHIKTCDADEFAAELNSLQEKYYKVDILAYSSSRNLGYECMYSAIVDITENTPYYDRGPR